MKKQRNIRFVMHKDRIQEAECFLCSKIGEHKWFDHETHQHICNDCVGAAMSIEKTLQSVSHEA